MNHESFGAPAYGSAEQVGKDAWANMQQAQAARVNPFEIGPPAYDPNANPYGQPPAYGNTAPANPYGQPPAYGNTAPANPYGQPPAYGNTAPANPYGQPPAYNGYTEAPQIQQEQSKGGRLRGMFSRAQEAVTGNSSNIGRKSQEMYNQLPPDAQAIARGVGQGALIGAMEGLQNRYTNADGKLRKVRIARDVVTGNVAGVTKDAVRGGMSGARTGGQVAAQQVISQNPYASGAANAYQQYRGY